MIIAFLGLPLTVRQKILHYAFADLLPIGPSGTAQTAFQLECEIKRSRKDTIARFAAVTFLSRSFQQAAGQPLLALHAEVLHARDSLQQQLDRLVSDAAREGHLEIEETGTIAEGFDEFDELVWSNNDLNVIIAVLEKWRRVEEAQTVGDRS